MREPLTRHGVRARVRDLFPATARAPSRVGLEHELITIDRSTGAAAPVERVRASLHAAGIRSGISFEPGGQIELNHVPRVSTPASSARDLEGPA